MTAPRMKKTKIHKDSLSILPNCFLVILDIMILTILAILNFYNLDLLWELSF